MKKFLLNISLFCVLFSSAAMAGTTDRWETLRAINWVENPTNHSRPGRHGELGPYQFRSATWRMHTERPFAHAVQRGASDEIAVKHYEWIKRSLERRGVEATAFNIAMAWNCGVDAVVSGRVPSASYNYAVRVTNLVGTLKERSEPLATAEEKIPSVVPAAVPAWKIEELEESAGEGDGLRFRVLKGTAPRFVLAAD